MYNRGPQSGRHLEAHLLYDFFCWLFSHLIGDFSAGISMLYDMGFRSDLAEGRKQLWPTDFPLIPAAHLCHQGIVLVPFQSNLVAGGILLLLLSLTSTVYFAMDFQEEGNAWTIQWYSRKPWPSTICAFIQKFLQMWTAPLLFVSIGNPARKNRDNLETWVLLLFPGCFPPF